MILTSQNLNWIAGIMEGEGTFGYYSRGPIMAVTMTDKDIIEKLSIAFKTKIWAWDRSAENNRKTQYRLTVNGSKAISWMMTLYILMGERRQNKIKEVIAKWKLSPGRAGWQKAFWQNRKEKANAQHDARRVQGLEKKSSNSGSNGSNSSKDRGSKK